MNAFLETERLLLRPLEVSDAAAFFEMNDSKAVSRYIRNPIKSIEEAERYIQKIIGEYQQNGIGRAAVILKATDELIGFSGLKLRTAEENGYSNIHDLGYRFAEEHWNKGYATEAAVAWLDYRFRTMNVTAIHACAVSENIGSNKVLQKLGFIFVNEYEANNENHNWYTLKNPTL